MSVRLSGTNNMIAAEAEYHLKCYVQWRWDYYYDSCKVAGTKMTEYFLSTGSTFKDKLLTLSLPE